MTTNAEKTLIRLDGRDYEVGSQAHLDKIEDTHKATEAKLQSKIDEQAGRLDAAEKAVETAKREKAEADTKAADAAKEREKTLAERVKSRVRLVMRALRLFGEDDGEGDDEKKMDAFAELSERELHLKAILKADPDFKADGKSDDYIAGKFEGAVDFLARANGVDGVVQVLEGRGGRRFDASDDGGSRGEHPVAKARRENLERSRKIAAPPVAAGEGGAR